MTQTVVPLTRTQWIARYGGAERLEREGFTVVPCMDCDDSICHGWRVVPIAERPCTEDRS